MGAWTLLLLEETDRLGPGRRHSKNNNAAALAIPRSKIRVKFVSVNQVISFSTCLHDPPPKVNCQVWQLPGIGPLTFTF